MAKKAATMTINQERDVYEAIGAFVFHFSQLEFTIRARLQRVLLLKPGYSDIVIGGYDFAMLCTVTREALLARKRISDKRKKLIKSFFSDCHGLANPSRNIVAHALWTNGGASHVSRNSLQRSLHYSDLNDLRALTTRAKALMMRMFKDRI
jgi:hypothetical protein